MRKLCFMIRVPLALCITALICIGAFCSYGANSETQTGMSARNVGYEAGEILPGVYDIAGAAQLRITNQSGEVILFRGRLTNETAANITVSEGDIVEFSGMLDMRLSKDTSQERTDRGFYSPLMCISLLQFIPGSYTEIHDGEISVYTESGELRLNCYFSDLCDMSGYIFAPGASTAVSIEATPEPTGVPIVLNSGSVYTIGQDLVSGEYEALGDGIVRVYDSTGTIKTVIKLKTENSSGEGVEHYRFKLYDNETFTVEGNILFHEIVLE